MHGTRSGARRRGNQKEKAPLPLTPPPEEDDPLLLELLDDDDELLELELEEDELELLELEAAVRLRVVTAPVVRTILRMAALPVSAT